MPRKRKESSEFTAFEKLLTTVLATTRADLQSRLDEAKRLGKKKRVKTSPASRAANDRA